MDVYLGPEGVLTGSAREAHKLKEVTSVVLRENSLSRKEREIQRKRKLLQSKIETLQEEFESVQEELNKSYIEEELSKKVLEENRVEITSKRNNEKSRTPEEKLKK